MDVFFVFLILIRFQKLISLNTELKSLFEKFNKLINFMVFLNAFSKTLFVVTQLITLQLGTLFLYLNNNFLILGTIM